MAYVAGDTILDDEYNNFVNDQTGPTNFSINHIFGTGSGVYGMGQSAVATVAAGSTITAAQWNSLFTAMTNMANHTNDTITSAAAVSSGNTIAIKAALQSNLNTLAASCAAGSPNATAISDSAATNKDTGTITKGTSASATCTYTFASSNARRWFFNTGGKLKVSFSRVGSGGAGKNTEWDDICSRMGTIILSQTATTRSGGSSTATTISSATGFEDLTTSDTTIATATANTSPYNSDAITLKAKLSGNNVILTATCNADVDGYDDTADNVGSIRGAYVSANPTTAQGLATVYTPTLS